MRLLLTGALGNVGSHTLPPASEDDPDLARSVNVDGARWSTPPRARTDPPRLLLASTLDVHGGASSHS